MSNRTKITIKRWPHSDVVFTIRAILGQICFNYLTFQYSEHQFSSILLLHWEILNKTLNYAEKYWLHFEIYTKRVSPMLLRYPMKTKVIEGWFQYILCYHFQIFQTCWIKQKINKVWIHCEIYTVEDIFCQICLHYPIFQYSWYKFSLNFSFSIANA